jgi:hypothetical protein
MRNLNLDELTEIISEHSSDIRFSDREHLEIKITQFLNLLFEQPISKRTLERISEDFDDLKNKIKEILSTAGRYSAKQHVTDLLISREKQGAFAFFEITKKFEIEKKNTNHYIDLSSEWYSPSGDYDNYQEYFNTYFFEPFIELIEWYLRESKIKQEIDYFSREEIELLEDRFELVESQLQKLGLGQEIIFNETDEIKELVNGLNKKNWTEVIKGKFIDTALGSLISIESAELIIKTLTGEDIKLK